MYLIKTIVISYENKTCYVYVYRLAEFQKISKQPKQNLGDLLIFMKNCVLRLITPCEEIRNVSFKLIGNYKK